MSIDVCAGAAGQVAGREEMGKGHSFRAGQADLRTRLRYTHLLASSFRTSEEEGYTFTAWFQAQQCVGWVYRGRLHLQVHLSLAASTHFIPTGGGGQGVRLGVALTGQCSCRCKILILN